MKLILLSALTVAGVAALLVACGATRAGYESAPYKVARNESGFEIRDYPALQVASTKRAGINDRDERFMRLFRYISGSNESKQKIAMTTPVFMDQTEERQEMMFVLPESLGASAPAPSGDAVSVKTIPARKMAVLRYSGSDSRDKEQAMEKQLRASLAAAGIQTAGGALFAYYDPPWTPSFARRNEVLIPVQ